MAAIGNNDANIEKVYYVGPTRTDDGGTLDRFNARPDGLGFVLWSPTMRHLPPPAEE